MKAIPIEIRQCVVQAYQDGHGTIREVAELFQVGFSSARRWIRRQEARKSLQPSHPAGMKPKLKAKHRAWVSRTLRKQPTLSSYEVTALFNKRFADNQVHRSSILRVIHGLGLSYKKNAGRASKTAKRCRRKAR